MEELGLSISGVIFCAKSPLVMENVNISYVGFIEKLSFLVQFSLFGSM